MEMKSHFVDYLNSVGVTSVLKEKINEFYEFYHFICPEEVEEIFITDNIKEDGERTYGKTCFFSENFYMDAHVFQKKDNFYMAPFKNQITSLSIEKKCYNFKKATENSRLAVFVNFQGEEKWLSAIKNNCDYLRNIMVKYFVPNLQTAPEALIDLTEVEIGEIDSLKKLNKQKKHIDKLKSKKPRIGSTVVYHTGYSGVGVTKIVLDKEKKKPQEKN